MISVENSRKENEDDGVIYADERLFNDIRKTRVCPGGECGMASGHCGHSLAMPDIHWVMVFLSEEWQASTWMKDRVTRGWVTISTEVSIDALRFEPHGHPGRIKELVEALFIKFLRRSSHRKDLKLSREEERRVLKKGAKWP